MADTAGETGSDNSLDGVHEDVQDNQDDGHVVAEVAAPAAAAAPLARVRPRTVSRMEAAYAGPRQDTDNWRTTLIQDQQNQFARREMAAVLSSTHADYQICKAGFEAGYDQNALAGARNIYVRELMRQHRGTALREYNDYF